MTDEGSIFGLGAKAPAADKKKPQKNSGRGPQAKPQETRPAAQADDKGLESTAPKAAPEANGNVAEPKQPAERKKRPPRPRRKPAPKPKAAAPRQPEAQAEEPPSQEQAPPAKTTNYEEQFAAASPDQVVAPEDVMPEASLEDLPQVLQDACAHAGWDKLMPVQALSIPYLMAGRDLMIQSRTGSGKTGSFILPILERTKPERAQCQALVLVPTRELAQQVAQEAQTLAGSLGVRVAAVYGGAGYGAQMEALREGAHIVVGTPGRVLDFLMRGSLSLDGIEVLVFDEADRMLSIGFYPDMKAVQRFLPKGRKVGMFMTSATYPPHVMRLAGEFMENPQLLSLSHKHVHVAETQHTYYECRPMEKDRALVRLIETENPTSAFVFCNTKQTVHYITAVLQRFGYDADELSGDLAQNKREQVLARCRSGNLRFLVATDVAARGIDIPDLSHVFLYEPPEDHEVYIHRAGRTGRAGASGEVISLVDVMEKLALERIGKQYKIPLEKRDLPTDEDVNKAIGLRLTAMLEARMRKRDNVQVERLNSYTTLAREMAQDEDGLKLLAMLLDENYQPVVEKAAPTPPKPSAQPKGGDNRSRRRPHPPKKAGGDRPRQDRDDQRGKGRGPSPQGGEGQGPAKGNEAKADDAAPAKPKKRRRRRRRKKPAGNANGNTGGNGNQGGNDGGAAGGQWEMP